MATKAAVFPVVTDHLRTLTYPTRRRTIAEFAWHYAAPYGAAGLLTWRGVRLADAGQVIGGGAVFAGFAFGLAVWVFELRLTAHRDPRVPRGGLLVQLIDELFKNVTYAVLVGLFLVLLAVAGTAYTSQSSLGLWWTAALTGTGLHFIITIMMCLKRLRAAYRQLTI